MNILILEDEPVSLKKLTHDLESLNHTVVGVTSSLDALEVYAKNQNFDLIITDLAMPFPSGTEFIKDVRKLDPKIPIIVISGTIDKKALDTIKHYKCTDILVKPHDKVRLKVVLDSLN